MIEITDEYFKDIFVHRNSYYIVRKFVKDFNKEWGFLRESTISKMMLSRYPMKLVLELLNTDKYIWSVMDDRDSSMDFLNGLFLRKRFINYEGDNEESPLEYLSYKDYYCSYMHNNEIGSQLKDDNFDPRKVHNMDLIIHMLETHKADLALYINSKDKWVSFIAGWRLRHGK